MNPTLCVLGGCNGEGKTTLARELLLRLGLMRFLNADEPETLGRLEIDWSKICPKGGGLHQDPTEPRELP